MTPRPGSTRGSIEAELAVRGLILRLVDTAGIREARDEVEAIGVEFSRRQLEGAQIELFVLDETRSPLEREGRRCGSSRGDLMLSPRVILLEEVTVDMVG